jgi:hypothetical protein
MLAFYWQATATQANARIDARFAEQAKQMDQRFSAVDIKKAEIDGNFRLIYWMLAVIIASTTVPALHTLLTG